MGAGGVGGRVVVPGRVGGVSAGGFSESLGGVVSFGGAPGGSGRSVGLLTLFVSFGGVVTKSGFVVGAGGDVVAEFFGGCGDIGGCVCAIDSAGVGAFGSRGTGLAIGLTGSFVGTRGSLGIGAAGLIVAVGLDGFTVSGLSGAPGITGVPDGETVGVSCVLRIGSFDAPFEPAMTGGFP